MKTYCEPYQEIFYWMAGLIREGEMGENFALTPATSLLNYIKAKIDFADIFQWNWQSIFGPIAFSFSLISPMSIIDAIKTTPPTLAGDKPILAIHSVAFITARAGHAVSQSLSGLHKYDQLIMNNLSSGALSLRNWWKTIN